MTPGEAVELIFEEFKSHCEAAYPVEANRPALSYDGIPFDPKSLTEPDLGFVRISVNHVDGDIVDLGGNLFRRTGSVIVQCFGPSGKGSHESSPACVERAQNVRAPARRALGFPVHLSRRHPNRRRRAGLVSGPCDDNDAV